MYSYGPPHMAEQKQDNQLEPTCSSSVRIRDVGLKTCQWRWTIGRSGERGSGISELAARHHDPLSGWIREFISFPSSKVNIKTLLEFELIYFDFTVQYVNYYATATHLLLVRRKSFVNVSKGSAFRTDSW